MEEVGAIKTPIHLRALQKQGRYNALAPDTS